MSKAVVKKVSKKNLKKFNKKKYVIFVIVFTGISIIVGLFLYLFTPRYLEKNLIEELEIDYNSNFTYNYGKVRYGSPVKNVELKPKVIGEVTTSKIGNYEVKYIFDNGFEFIQEVKVIDRKLPEIIIGNDVEMCANGTIKKLDIKAIDEYDGDLTSHVKTEFENNVLHLSVADTSGNVATKEISPKFLNSGGPSITLNGASEVVIKVGETYKEENAKSIDICDGELPVNVSGNVDTKKVGDYKITYTAINSLGKEAMIERTVKVVETRKSSNPNPKNLVGAKIIYLTFDDGPSKYTSKLLDILKKYNVKATFFVTGYGSDSMIKREYDEGHTVALHSYSHDYCKIYKDVNSFFSDLNRVRDRVIRITGYSPKYIRFAGGSSNTVSKGCDGGKKVMSQLVKEVEKRGYRYFDWNVVSGDAGWTTKTSEVYNYVVKALKSNYSIVLQHDSKGYSVDAVESIIKYGLSNGFTFRKIDDSTPVVHHNVSN